MKIENNYNTYSQSRVLPDKVKGFSLVEMLMALLVASLLLATLAPVMTRRFGENVNVSGTGANTLMEPSGAKCFTENTNDILLKDIGTINVVMASGGGGGGSASSGYVKKISPNAVQAGNDNATSTIPITKYMQNVKLVFMTGGGGGAGAGGAHIEGTSGKPNANLCKEYGIGKTDTTGHTGNETNPVITYDGSGLCVTSYNQVSSSGCTTYTNGSFSTPVCNWSGAAGACSGLKSKWNNDDWRLPETGELKNWNSDFITKSVANGGIYLCSHGGTPNCLDVDSGNYQYRPYRTWSKTKYNKSNNCINNDARYAYQLFGKGWNEYHLCLIPATGGNVRQYGTVRCVYSGIISNEKFTSYSGGGGGASASISNNDAINEKINNAIKEVINSGSTGSIVLTAGKGGEGGIAPSSFNTTSSKTPGSGKNSCIAVMKGGNEIYKYCVLGGNAGGNAEASSTEGKIGIGGTERSAQNGCSEYINGVKQASASAVCGAKGNAGTNGKNKEEAAADGGIGGISNLGGSNTTGAGYNTSTGTGITLNDAVNPGAGGGSGSALNKTTIGAGARGSGGRIVITYEEYTPGSGGGGGAGGNLALINNWFIGNDENSVCDVTVGGGGEGGTIVANNSTNGKQGNNGGVSSIICHHDNAKYSIRGGIGGGGGLNDGASTDISNPNAKKGGKNDSNTKIVYTGGHNTNTKLTIKTGGEGSPAGENDKKGYGGDGGNALGLLSAGVLKGGTTASVNGTGYSGSLPDINATTYETLRAGTYPVGARGGGGGAFKNTSLHGKGGDGEPGYVCIYWVNE